MVVFSGKGNFDDYQRFSCFISKQYQLSRIAGYICRQEHLDLGTDKTYKAGTGIFRIK
uniref:Uncharacterized protein n=1 Tax=Arundo donax TaxID=35708 RepID=A0A0A9GFZ7_ARUDO